MDEIKNNIAQLKQAVVDIEGQANRQNREMTGTEKNLRSEILQQIHELEMSLPEKALTVPSNYNFTTGKSTPTTGVTTGRDYCNMFSLNPRALAPLSHFFKM
jgi:hypothetical protein